MKNIYAFFAAVFMTAILATPIASDETSGFSHLTAAISPTHLA